MNYTIKEYHIKTIKPLDPGWILTNGLICSPRAGFEINSKCPREYKLILQECINNHWLVPVAYVYDHELTFDTLKGNTL